MSIVTPIVSNKAWRKFMRKYLYEQEKELPIGYRSSRDYKRTVRRSMRYARKILNGTENQTINALRFIVG